MTLQQCCSETVRPEIGLAVMVGLLSELLRQMHSACELLDLQFSRSNITEVGNAPALVVRVDIEKLLT